MLPLNYSRLLLRVSESVLAPTIPKLQKEILQCVLFTQRLPKLCQHAAMKKGEKDACVLQRKRLVTTALHPDRWEELLDSHCRGQNCRRHWEIQCSCLKAWTKTVILKERYLSLGCSQQLEKNTEFVHSESSNIEDFCFNS